MRMEKSNKKNKKLEKLRKFLKAHRLPITYIAMRKHITPPTFTRHLKGEGKKPSDERRIFEAVEDYFQEVLKGLEKVLRDE